jgi:hypothetical protein
LADQGRGLVVMADGLKTFFRELLDPSPIKEKHVDLTMEQFEELQRILENAYEYKHARVKSS